MLGYLTDNRDYFKGNLVEYYLKKGIAFSGGTQQHYEFFKNILTYSITNVTTKRALHDIRAGIATLHLFPLKTRILLSIAFYRYENTLAQQYNDCILNTDNTLLPSTQLLFTNIIKKEFISEELLVLVDDVALNLTGFNTLKQYSNIDLNSNLEGPFLENITIILNKYNTSITTQENYMTVIKNNDRLSSIILAAKALNYKQESITYLTEALTAWHQNSNT